MSDANREELERRLRQQLEAAWPELSQRATGRLVRWIKWERQLEQWRTWTLAAILLMAVQVGCDWWMLLRLERSAVELHRLVQTLLS